MGVTHNGKVLAWAPQAPSVSLLGSAALWRELSYIVVFLLYVPFILCVLCVVHVLFVVSVVCVFCVLFVSLFVFANLPCHLPSWAQFVQRVGFVKSPLSCLHV